MTHPFHGIGDYMLDPPEESPELSPKDYYALRDSRYRLCPGCRFLDGEHDFGPTCTLAGEDEES